MAALKAAERDNPNLLEMIDVRSFVPDYIKLERDVTFARYEERELKLDLYSHRDQTRAAPGIIFVHGGGWRAGRKEAYRFYSLVFAAEGYVCASISMRLSDEATFPAAVQDVSAAVRWLRKNAAQYKVDPNRIALVGNSSGAHVSLLAAYASSDPEFASGDNTPGTSGAVQAVVSFYGHTDLTAEFAMTNDNVAAFLGKRADEAPELYRRASPIVYATSKAPPTLLFHGTIDDDVPVSQSDLLRERLRELGVPCVYDRIEGWPHGLDLITPINRRCQWFMRRFFLDHLGPGKLGNE